MAQQMAQQMEQQMEHEGRTAIVTGGAGGLGEAIGMALAAEGAAIAVTDVDRDAAGATAARITEKGGRALAIEADVSTKQSVVAMVEQTVDVLGGVDILVNNAGIQHVAPLVDYPLERWERLIGVMLTGTFLCTQAAVRVMIGRGGGSIVNISSTLGRQGATHKSAYTAAKHGIVGLTRSNALELAEHDIRVNAVCPGITQTPLVDDQLDDLAAAHGCRRDEVVERVFLSNIPQKRVLEPREVADCVVFLCSLKARAFTGQALSVAAGAQMP
ncbi:MAG: 3-hydroxybutyrate dehydrogenase [Phycisphaeraceae bacterium]|nr:3-hydroxybutyrate dehydrogenase [Phycisphaeraceae bacterium]